MAAVCSWVILTVLSLVQGHDRPHKGALGNREHAMAYFLSALVTCLGIQHTKSR
ncbi:hypothetical protein [Lichenifustis flavocetrariae]|uniref:Uncharacterized protein n=1 Tax=Lichenifustis flavocetrariae TaxID=2949735 RepID=A0AA41ZA03_9HYPH|nr:hypothetical protein [Lichenifustis flavocetrariae]MCW6513030.1 hypothetical protein [Lichenifustis flavocetrariae]